MTAEISFTRAELERMDFVDNAIFELIYELAGLNPDKKWFDWDIDLIGEIRDIISGAVVAHGIMTEMEFYPYRLTFSEEGQ